MSKATFRNSYKTNVWHRIKRYYVTDFGIPMVEAYCGHTSRNLSGLQSASLDLSCGHCRAALQRTVRQAHKAVA